MIFPVDIFSSSRVSDFTWDSTFHFPLDQHQVVSRLILLQQTDCLSSFAKKTHSLLTKREMSWRSRFNTRNTRLLLGGGCQLFRVQLAFSLFFNKTSLSLFTSVQMSFLYVDNDLMEKTVTVGCLSCSSYWKKYFTLLFPEVPRLNTSSLLCRCLLLLLRLPILCSLCM